MRSRRAGIPIQCRAGNIAAHRRDAGADRQSVWTISRAADKPRFHALDFIHFTRRDARTRAERPGERGANRAVEDPGCDAVSQAVDRGRRSSGGFIALAAGWLLYRGAGTAGSGEAGQSGAALQQGVLPNANPGKYDQANPSGEGAAEVERTPSAQPGASRPRLI